MTEPEARKEYTNLLKLCSESYYKKIERGVRVDELPNNLLEMLDQARLKWITTKINGQIA